MKNINVKLEMRALDAEKAGMEADNQHRLSCGESILYGDDEFFVLAG